MKISYNKEIKDFTESKLIAYIGNKRRLIKLIIKALETLDVEPSKKPTLFYDPFAGTGVVSRLAKALGFQVICNDWEPYSYFINKAHIEINKTHLNSMFSDKGGIEKVIEYYNTLPSLSNDKSYIAKYYCPESTKHPKKDERLFYTKETGENIDKIREAIAREYETSNCNKSRQKERNMLLAALIYEASTRANTSGVFKAFHNGFGGLGKDALSRIMKPLKLSEPELIDNNHRHKVFCKCANKLTKKLKDKLYFDVVYLDPPYNQHQYGSNYHLLNTIALNDKPEVNKNIYINGKKIDKSAIRKDWVKTKSPYCYKKSAIDAFESLINDLNCRYILVSYSIDGIIPFEKMLELLSSKGKLTMVSSEYVKYRGGRQAITTKTNNIEFVLIVDTTKVSSKSDVINIHEILLNQKLDHNLKQSVDENIFDTIDYKTFEFDNNNNLTKVYSKKYDKYKVMLEIKDGYQINNYYFTNDEFKNKNKNDIFNLPYNIKNNLFKDICKVTDVNKEQEIMILFNLLSSLLKLYNDKPNVEIINRISEYLPKIPFLINKFNSPKVYPKYIEIKKKIDELIIRIKNEVDQKHPIQKLNSAVKQLDRIALIKNKKILAAQEDNKL